MNSIEEFPQNNETMLNEELKVIKFDFKKINRDANDLLEAHSTVTSDEV